MNLVDWNEIGFTISYFLCVNTFLYIILILFMFIYIFSYQLSLQANELQVNDTFTTIQENYFYIEPLKTYRIQSIRLKDKTG